MAYVNDGASLLAGIAASGLSIKDAWLCYFAIGGSNDLASLQAYLAGSEAWEHLEHVMAASAINEILDGLGSDIRVT